MQQLAQYAKRSRAELIDLIKTLCRIPAPSNHEQARAAFIREWFVDNCPGADVYTDEADNTILRLGADGQHTVFMAHTDTVFPDLEPFVVTERENRLYCPGVGDDTTNLALLMLAARYVINSGIKTRPALFAADSGEEGLGNLRGCRKIMEDYAGRVLQVVSFDGQLGELYNRAVGSVRYRVALTSEGGHSYGDFGASNAIEIMARLINDLYKIVPPQNPFGKATYNIGTISGGTSVNTIAESCEMLFEIRACDRVSLAVLDKEFKAAVDRAAAVAKDIWVTVVGERPCGGSEVSEQQAQLEKIAFEQIRQITGEPPMVKPLSTDCNIPLSLGIPAITLGGYYGEGAHNRGEWIDTDTLTPGLELVLSLILKLINIEGQGG